ncbi:peptidoglycan DD-metalloendopeptidase family protein [Flavobacterium sp.]|jgi:murein DD-endopeptidase MepM/ murein hydrolase activator NlpD|uniref:peptidoglycan DD-metalloendopeptidase family protein n=1 Tax=Flavobacterium sp. TaxID=239 RepID=UPI0037BE970F
MENFEKSLKKIKNVKVIDASIPYETYISLDLSVQSKQMSKFSPKTAEDYSQFLNKYLYKNKAKVAYGGYLEKRNLYERSTIFNEQSTEVRNIHIGLDLWIAAGTSVLAALEGTVHSFQNNTNLGDYGPTIILQHTLNNCQFYTLYGHLALESIALLHIGQPVKQGDKIAELGNSSVNGDYAPHLHFQIIKNIGDYFGDYPGVCSEKDLDYFKENCPNPNLLLKINS